MWCFVYVNTSGWVLVAHCVDLLSISTVAAHSGGGEGCWDVPQEWGQLLPTAQSPGGGCGEASRGAGEAPRQAGHPLLWGCKGSRQPAHSQHGRGGRDRGKEGRRDGGKQGSRDGILGSPEEQAQCDPRQKALELAETAPESKSTMGGREICL